MNTKIEYLYRDASNYKVWNEAVVKGEITKQQEDAVFAALRCDGDANFVPKEVGLPEKRFDTWTEDDVDVFELQGFEATNEEPTVEITIDELVARLIARAGGQVAEKETIPEPVPSSLQAVYRIVLYDKGDNTAVIAYILQLKACGKPFSPVETLREAAKAFIQTDAGKAVVKRNCGNFNMGDALEMPTAFCAKFGFEVISAEPAYNTADLNECFA